VATVGSLGRGSRINRINAKAWPLVGRTEELEFLRQLRATSPGMSAVISGPAGVGKSRLARAALGEASRDGWATLIIRGSAGLGAVPLGPFRTLLRTANSSELTDIAESVKHELLAMRTPKGLVILADDAYTLDEPSSGLVHQLVAAGLILAILTSRPDVDPPAAVTDLWKDGLAERIELQNLSRLETAELLAAGLGGSVQDSSAEGIWHVTRGNPLYLREVVLSSAETGALRQVDGEWRWGGEWATGARLQEIVAERLGRLDPDELSAIEMLALAGSLPLGLVTSLTTARALEELEGRALVTTERSGRRLEVAIAHPLHAEVLRSRMPELRQRSMRRNLADALQRTGTRRAADRVRLACWSLDSGLDVDPMTLVLASDAALSGIGPALSGRLREILPDAPDLPVPGAAVRRDYELAVRLAQLAYDRTGTLKEGVGLASTLAWTGATASAEAVLAELVGKADAVDDRLRLALALGWVRFWGRYHVEEAITGLLEAVDSATETCDPVLLAEVFEHLAGISLNTSRPADSLAYAERAAVAQGVELGQSVAAPPAAAALTYLGRCGDAIALVDQAVLAAHARGHMLSVAILLFTRAGALARLGDLEEARQLGEWLRDVAIRDGLLDATAIFGVLLGEVYLRQGRPASAGRIFGDSSGLLAEHDVFGYRAWALSGLARAKAAAGEEESAMSALDEARRARQIKRHYDISLYLAEVEVERLAGRSAAAVRAASEAVDWARANGLVIEEANALDAWVRIEPSSVLAERLGELATLTDSKLVGVGADHARALVAGDPEGLLEASEGFAGMTAWWMAAEAAAAAARILDRRNQTRAAKAANRVADQFAAHGEGRPRSMAETGSGPTRLTRREREIAVLAAAGRSTKEIASRMYLSPRTVENHLYHAYIKLGVTDRAALSAALGPAERSE